ncbi:MAG: GGDEF domain-containing protein [Elusimicrobia bacterium]|nr:GGDEF domain-containing protein [Elusimicrobiota bacterium]
MSIKTKLLVAAAVTLFCVFAFGIWSENHQSRLGSVLSQVLANNVEAMNAATELKRGFIYHDDLILRYMLTGDERLLDSGGRSKKLARRYIADIKRRSLSPRIREMMDELLGESRSYFEEMSAMTGFYQQYRFPEGGQIETIAVWGKQFPQHKKYLTALTSSGQERLERIYEICDTLIDINRYELERARQDVESMLDEGRTAAGWAALLTFALAALVAVLSGYSILSPLEVLLRGVERVVQGDLNFEMPVTSADEIGRLTQAFNTMTRSLKEKQHRLVQETITDGLTGLYNFRYFQEVIAREMERARRYDRPLSVLIVDIDHFKHFNDNLGHEMGNVALTMAAKILKESLRPEDTLSRYGGEEFVVLLPDTSKKAAQAVAHRLRSAIESAQFPGGERQPLGRVTVSIGGATYPGDSQSSQGLIRSADKGLYQAKETGRNRFAWAF